MLISLRNARRRDQGAAACPQQAIAARDAAVRCFRNRLPSCARAQRANFGCCFHNSCLCVVDSTLHPKPPAPQDETGSSLCTSCGEQRRVVEKRGEAVDCRAVDTTAKAGTCAGVGPGFSGNWQLGTGYSVSKPATGTCFPLTIPSYGGKLAIVGARALSLPPRLMRGNRKIGRA